MVEGHLLNYETHDEYIYAIGLQGPYGQYSAFDRKELTLEEMPETVYYTKVNYNTGDMKQSDDLSTFDEAEQEIFEEMLTKETLYE